MTVRTTSAFNWPDINRPHPCTCPPKDKGSIMVTIKARADQSHAWQLFTGCADWLGDAEEDGFNHAAEWFGGSDILTEP